MLLGDAKDGRRISTELRMNGLKKRNKFTVDLKLAILREWKQDRNGVEMAAKYQVHPQTLYRWKRCFEELMTKRRLLKDLQRGLGESVHYFSANNKPTRESWVAIKFLKNIGLKFHEKEVVPSDDPPDVNFRDARFEIKEILDPGRKRHREFKEQLRKSRTTEDPDDLLGPCTFIEDLTPEDILQLIEKELKELDRKKYAEGDKHRLDLLFYINLIHRHFKDDRIPNSYGLSRFGWRSVSALILDRASLVYYANDVAPLFLQEKRGQLICSRAN